MKEYLDPSDWTLKLVNVDNDAALPEWLEVPEGAERLYDFLDGLEFYKNENRYAWNSHDETWVERDYAIATSVKLIWSRQKPRVRVYATLSQSEWQPDWTLAPEGYDWYAVDSDGTGTFTNYEPFMFCGRWAPPYSSHRTGIKKLKMPGFNFNYQGDWRDSLRKRKKIGGVTIL